MFLKFITIRSFFVFLFATSFSFLGYGKDRSKPNIVFILVDDLGFADVGFNGSKWFETPNIDALASNSLRFENAYTYPTCSPSRSAFFTGKQSFRTGVYTVPVLESGTAEENIFSRWTVEKSHSLFSDHLAKTGYQSIHIGKWHIVGPDPINELASTFPLTKKLTQPRPGDFNWVALHNTLPVKAYYPEGRGFVKNVGGTFRGDPALEEGGYNSKTKGYHAPFSNPFIKPKPSDEWLTDRLTEEALEFMEENKAKPFFVNLHYYAVHRPVTPRNQTLFDKYMNKPGDEVTGQGVGPRRNEMAAYATMVESVDDNVQRLLTYLDKSGLRENTIIIFTSDNGYNGGQSSNNLMRDSKGYIYEGGIRVPAFINWPGHITARNSQLAMSLLDYYPTFLELAGIKSKDKELDGKSLVELFNRDTEAFKSRPLFWQINSQYKHGTCSVIRKNNYKLIQFLADGKLELYNLVDDPKEADNLVLKAPQITENLLRELQAWRKMNLVPLPPNAIVSN